jgi:transcription elongation factor Elf1
MIPEKGKRRDFKRCLLRTVLMMECSGCGDEEVSALVGLRKNLIMARFLCKRCETSVRSADEMMQAFHVTKYKLLPKV